MYIRDRCELLALCASVMSLCACEHDSSPNVMKAVQADAAAGAKQDAGPAPKRPAREAELLPEDTDHLQQWKDAPAWELDYWTQSCYGTCPVYEVMFDQSGNYYYDGRGGVAVSGVHEPTTNADEVKALYNQLLDLGYLRLKPSYQSAADGCSAVWTDGPTVSMRLTIPEENKPLIHYAGCELHGPVHDALLAIEQAIFTFPPVQRLTARGEVSCTSEHTFLDAIKGLGEKPLTFVLTSDDHKPVGTLKFMKAASTGYELTLLDCQGKELWTTQKVSMHSCGVAVKPDKDASQATLSWPGVDQEVHAVLIGIENGEHPASQGEYDVRVLSLESETTFHLHRGEACTD